MKIELHLLQNFAPSNLNRDDSNMPKTCLFGDVPRARISSQCFKRAVRMYFQDNALAETGLRTKRLKKELTDRLNSEFSDAEALSALLNIFIESCYSGRDKNRQDETSVLLYIGEAEIAEAAACVLENRDVLLTNSKERATWAALGDDEKKKKKEPSLWKSSDVEKRLKGTRLSADIALFGRMLAENPGRNVEAACQVAHALSTHAISLETDFYTAVDDLNTQEETGAGMLGVTGYNSACYYRYALIDRNQLISNLNGDTALADTAIDAFLKAFVDAVPTGKQNSMAAQNRPNLGLFVVREKGVPCSLANAFVRPVRTHENSDLIENSKRALASYFQRMDRVYELYQNAQCALFHDGIEAPQELNDYECGPLSAAISATMATVRGGNQG